MGKEFHKKQEYTRWVNVRKQLIYLGLFKEPFRPYNGYKTSLSI